MINTCANADNVAYEPLKTESAPALDEDIVTPVVPTETHYSWFYYEREDQFDELIESLNVKGQRERKLQENLKKIKDRLKLKRPKRVAAVKLAEGEGQPSGVEVAAEGSNTKNEEGVVPAEAAEGVEGPSVVNEPGSEA